MKNRNALVIDCNACVCQQIQPLSTKGLDICCVDSLADAQDKLSHHEYSAALIVLDPGTAQNQEEIESLIASTTLTEWIAIVSPQSLQTQSFRTFVANAFHDYHTLPVDLQRLGITIGHAMGKSHLRHSLVGEIIGESGRFGITGRSPTMCKFLMRLEKVIDADLAVLIGGETGTGKELVARAIHHHSRRSNGPFVAVNCGAIPGSLIQSELFGHEKGAFTGAGQRKIGSIEAANHGVLFLDEIGDLPLNLQSNLLRVLQERSITRLGSTQAIPVDFRIVAASHIDLQTAVQTGHFREDLYFRLNVLRLDLPPLRLRENDVLLLAEVILRKLSENTGHCRAHGFSAQAKRVMCAYPWPGNVRELINRIHRAVIFCENKLISTADLGLEAYADTNAQESQTLGDARASFDKKFLENCLRLNGNNVSRTARQLGVSRVTFYRMMGKHNIAASYNIPQAQTGSEPVVGSR
jgi:DNA-binding NtrC family response regulator